MALLRLLPQHVVLEVVLAYPILFILLELSTTRHLNSAILTQMAWLGIFFSSTIVPNSYTVTGIRTHVSGVAPDWDLSDALPTELHVEANYQSSYYALLRLFMQVLEN